MTVGLLLAAALALMISASAETAEAVAARYEARTGHKKKVTGIQCGYEARCAAPHAFDVILRSQLGAGAYRGLVERELDGHMVSTSGQLQLRFVPFSELNNPETMLTETRYIEPDSDFHQLARVLETRLGPLDDWLPSRRSEPQIE